MVLCDTIRSTEMSKKLASDRFLSVLEGVCGMFYLLFVTLLCWGIMPFGEGGPCPEDLIPPPVH